MEEFGNQAGVLQCNGNGDGARIRAVASWTPPTTNGRIEARWQSWWHLLCTPDRRGGCTAIVTPCSGIVGGETSCRRRTARCL